MMETPELIALRQVLDTCLIHQDTLQDALSDLDTRNLSLKDLGQLSKSDRRLLDQFAYRFTRLQDDMGARLFPAALRALGEDVGPMAALDRLARLEQLGWIHDAERWAELRRIRNEFAHDYPETLEERHARLALAIASAQEMSKIFQQLVERVRERFPALSPQDANGHG